MSDASTLPTRAVEDRYDVERKIGEGASAETFLAHDREDGGRQVVIKSLHVDRLDGWKFFELFEREAITLSKLRHHGVPEFVEWFASGSDSERPRFHIVQEFIEGRSLQEAIDEGGLGPTEFDQLALGLLDILDYLHNRTPPIYHRDIKPSNIIVRPMGAPVLIDFGSVCYGWRAEDERGSTVAGTHGYMPPEQYMGQVSARSDLYGLGATLLHVASGREPSSFSFDDGRLSVPDSISLRAGARAALTKMLEPAPRDRPQSAREARELFVDLGESGEQQTALVPVDSGHEILLPPRTAVRRIRVEGAPIFVDLGPPPRDPRGQFSDVYYSLDPHWASLSIGVEGVTRMGNQANILLWLLVFSCTGGLWALIRLSNRGARRARAQLFRDGEFARAIVVGLGAANQTSSRVTYEFEVRGERFRASSLVAVADASHMLLGDEYGVLYDSENPGNNTIVYR